MTADGVPRDRIARSTAGALTIAAVLTMAGCAASSTAHPASTQPAGTSRPGATQTPASALPRSAAAAIARAKAIGLKPTDAPGFTATARGEDPKAAAANAALAACLGGASASPVAGGRANLANVDSDAFTAGTGLMSQQLSSNVTVVRSLAEARDDLAGFTGPRAKGCIGRFVDALLRSLTGADITLGSTSVTTLPTTAPPSVGSFGYRVTVSATAAGQPTHFYVDVFGFVRATTEVSLTTLSIGELFPARTEQALFAVLLHRASTVS